MPLLYEINTVPSASIYIWKIEEESAFFIEKMYWDQKQLDWLESIHPLKKIEYLASRYLIYKITGKLDSHIYKDEAGKLHLKNSHKNLSISHSGEWVGLALSEKKIGYDIQKFSSKIKYIAKRFLSEEELSLLHKMDEDDFYIIAWVIKEAVYKANGKKGIIFSKQILLDLSDLNIHKLISVTKLKQNEDYKIYDVFHQKMENFAWAIAMES
jgi:4'-phosphopantetheinyl transferase